ncbi:mechanosensitive ion channel family protein [Campylobacter sp.]|uniref:mechanosensitive ion channel family protein n=1 Tax=Campylobacter sp. TaxID=205 RepID=UPI002704D593|nr:mechanosensitive ion channel family protein [Campylobacter sp.]
MKKLILAIFSFIILPLNLVAADIDDVDIVVIIRQIDKINNQIALVKAQANDKNETADANSLFKGILVKKNQLMDQIPSLLMQAKVGKEEIDKFKEDKTKLENRVKKLKNSNNKRDYIQSAIELQKMNIDEIFYGSVLSLEKLFNKRAKPAKVRTLLEETLLNLQTSSYAKIKELKEGLDPTLIEEFAGSFEAMELHKKTFEEILVYLKNNADLMSSNYVFSELNLQVAIDFVNAKIPFKIEGINFGKIIIIMFVFLFFVSFTKILSKITYFLMLKMYPKGNQEEETKDRVVNIIKRPMLFMLTVHAIEICLAIFYYPVPVPIKFANYSAIVFIFSTAWLMLSMLDGYGIVFISEITKKSGRKEVINLILKIIYFIIVVIALLFILSRLGFNVSAIIASLGIGGLAVALAAKDILANFFASVMLLFDNSFSQGDWIVCGDIEGTVVEIGLRKTTVRTFDNALIFVPNLKLASDPIRNWSRRRLGRRIRMNVGLEYGATSAQVKKCADDIRNMLLNHPAIAKSDDLASKSTHFSSRFRQNIVSVDDLAGYKTNLFVVVDEFADSSINIMIYCFSKTIIWGDFLEVKQDVMLKIMDIVEANGLSFAFPSQSVYLENLKDIDKALKELR